MQGYNLVWPGGQMSVINPPSDAELYDLIEFAYEHIAEPKDPQYHSYMSHTHYTYDQKTGREKFTADVNRIFERNGIAYNLEHGEVERIAPAVLRETLTGAVFNTGDAVLDDLLETARNKFLNRSLDVRRESLEKLWDAWERLKTIEPGKDKKASVKALLDKAATQPFRQRIEDEANTLTEIGNKFLIRHTEIDKVPITESAHVDYLFHRLFSLLWLILKTTGRGTTPQP
jgi:hypothetical protein